jgi:hypothetical protein
MSATTNDTPKKGNPPADWRERFIVALTSSGNVSWSALKANVTRRHVYRVRDEDSDFAAAWDEALDEATDVLEAEARRRALKGVPEPVYQKGEKVGTITRYSDTLLIFLLKGMRPEKYRERLDHNLHGPGNGPIRHINEPDLSAFSDEELELYESLTAKLANPRSDQG